MAADRVRRHILVPTPATSEQYTPHKRGMQPKRPPAPVSRAAHAKTLKASFGKAELEANRRREIAGVVVHGAKPGLYIEFESHPGFELSLGSLENKKKGIELVAVTQAEIDEAGSGGVQRATVFVPDGQLKHFVERLEKYSLETPKAKNERRHEDMLDRIANIRLATLRGLWTDTVDVYPDDNEIIWWEVWLRCHDGKELERLLSFVSAKNLEVSSRRLEFADRIVTLVRGTPEQMAASIDLLADLAEVRKAKELASVFVGMPPEEQAEWVEDLRRRMSFSPEDAPAVCVLDTGVNREHPLLEPSLSDDDAHAVDLNWGSADDGGGPRMQGHGTEMAGLALWGDLTPALGSTLPILLTHRLESVKIVPPRGTTDPDLYGAVTAEATSRPEIQAPDRRRCFSMAVTTTDSRDRGMPTSWSAAIDALAAGRSFDPTSKGLIYLDGPEEDARRLFVISAGNVSLIEVAHIDRSDTEAVHDPAQAWNALTVGAFTEMAEIREPSLRGWEPVASPGELSPYSTTSVRFSPAWPIKPDVVFEGGNAAHAGDGEVMAPVDDLSLLTTYFKPSQKSLVTTCATSAACAQVARIAAILSADYPEFWPETIRGLIVHSARWTRVMEANLRGAGGKRARQRLIRRYGFGVPGLVRVLRSANDSLTLVAQDRIHPFVGGRMGEMHLHRLPWPKEVLEGLGATAVRLRVTVSYFVEPNPGRRGWKKRHRYASHGLRFDVIQPTESIEDFRKRLNQKALADDESKPSTISDSSAWYLGEEARNKGSLHSDLWVGTAADLADRGTIGIYPVGGWWKEQPKNDRSSAGARYSLIVSIETDAADVDLWTPVAIQAGVPVDAIVVEV